MRHRAMQSVRHELVSLTMAITADENFQYHDDVIITHGGQRSATKRSHYRGRRGGGLMVAFGVHIHVAQTWV
jgi:hypothetical protein